MIGRALLIVGALLVTVPTAHGATVRTLHRSPSAWLFAPTVSGETVAWIRGEGGSGECAPGRKRVERLVSPGRTRALTTPSGGGQGNRGCVFRPVAAGRRVIWAVSRPFDQMWEWKRGDASASRFWQFNGSSRSGPGYDATPTGVVFQKLGSGPFQIELRFVGSHGAAPTLPRAAFPPRDQQFQIYPRLLGRDVVAAVGRTLYVGAASLPLPAGFRGLDAADGAIVARVHAGGAWSLVRADVAAGTWTTILAGAGTLSLPAVARGSAVVIARDGTRERILSVRVAGGARQTLAARQGVPLWGAGEVADGRPVAYDGARVVWTAKHAVLGLTP